MPIHTSDDDDEDDDDNDDDDGDVDEAEEDFLSIPSWFGAPLVYISQII